MVEKSIQRIRCPHCGEVYEIQIDECNGRAVVSTVLLVEPEVSVEDASKLGLEFGLQPNGKAGELSIGKD